MKAAHHALNIICFFLPFSFVPLIPTVADASDLKGIRRNNQGVGRFKAEKYHEAYDQFVQGLGELPFQAEPHYNLGRVYYENKDYEKALKESLTAERLAHTPEMKFLSLFQAGAAAASMKKVDKALELYQAALELAPESKETKTNIELLLAGGQGGGGEDQQQDQNGDPKDQKKDGQGEKDQEKKQDQPRQNPKQQPKQFKSEQLSKKDVENILDELKQQEEQIRAKFQREGAKDAPKDKDW